jgi:hypothetical protein
MDKGLLHWRKGSILDGNMKPSSPTLVLDNLNVTLMEPAPIVIITFQICWM